MRIKIISNGLSSGTQIIDLETGKPVQYVTRISWSLSASDSEPASAEASFCGCIQVLLWCSPRPASLSGRSSGLLVRNPDELPFQRILHPNVRRTLSDAQWWLESGIVTHCLTAPATCNKFFNSHHHSS